MLGFARAFWRRMFRTLTLWVIYIVFSSRFKLLAIIVKYGFPINKRTKVYQELLRCLCTAMGNSTVNSKAMVTVNIAMEHFLSCLSETTIWAELPSNGSYCIIRDTSSCIIRDTIQNWEYSEDSWVYTVVGATVVWHFLFWSISWVCSCVATVNKPNRTVHQTVDFWKTFQPETIDYFGKWNLADSNKLRISFRM